MQACGMETRKIEKVRNWNRQLMEKQGAQKNQGTSRTIALALAGRLEQVG
jgi:hypothetical protein